MAKLRILLRSVQTVTVELEVADDVAANAAENIRYSDPSAVLSRFEPIDWSSPRYEVAEVVDVDSAARLTPAPDRTQVFDPVSRSWVDL